MERAGEREDKEIKTETDRVRERESREEGWLVKYLFRVGQNRK